MKTIFLILISMSFSLHANECIELSKCAEYMSKITGKKYLYDSQEIRGGMHSTTNLQITNENADNIFTFILDLNGYTRVPTMEKDTYLIINSRDLRYKPLPLIKVSSEIPLTLPANYDYYMVNYKFKHFNHGQLREASNSMRPFMSRYGRIIETKGTGILAIQENAAQLSRLYEIIKSFDRELSKDEIQAYKEREAEYKEERKEQRKFERNRERDLKNENGKVETKK